MRESPNRTDRTKIFLRDNVRSPGFEPGFSAWRADVLDQAGRQPQRKQTEIRRIYLVYHKAIFVKATLLNENGVKPSSPPISLVKHVDLL